MDSSEKITWHTEQRRLGELIEWDKNPRKLSKNDAEQLRKSIAGFGIVDPFIVNTNNRLIGGHQRKKVMLLDGFEPETLVDVRIPSRELSERELEELAIRLNRNTGEWDFNLLEKNFSKEELIAWGFMSDELLFEDNHLLRDPGARLDKAEELRQKWGVESGQLWHLGEHRLACGDNTDRAALEELMRGGKANIVFTDPPYGIEYRYVGYSDHREGYYAQMEKAFGLVDEFLAANASIYIKQYTGNLFDFREVMPKRWRYKNLILWKNASQARPKDNYNNTFELIYEFDLSDIDLSVLTFLELGEPYFDKLAERRLIEWEGTEKLAEPVRRGQMWNLWDDIKPLPGGFMKSNESLSDGSYKLHSCQMPTLLPERAMKFSSR